MLTHMTTKIKRMMIMLMMIMIISGFALSLVYGCKEIVMMMMVIMKMVCIENNKVDFDDFKLTMILIMIMLILVIIMIIMLIML